MQITKWLYKHLNNNNLPFRNNSFRIFTFLILLLYSSCHSRGKTRSGYEYIHHIQNEGERPAIGNKVDYKVDVFFGNKLINSTENQQASIILRELQEKKIGSPIEESLRLMTVGDSLTVFSSLKSNSADNSIIEQKEFLTYNIVLKGINSTE